MIEHIDNLLKREKSKRTILSYDIIKTMPDSDSKIPKEIQVVMRTRDNRVLQPKVKISKAKYFDNVQTFLNYLEKIIPQN